MKVIEGRESDSSIPTMLGAPEYVLTARDAVSNRTIATVKCIADSTGKVLMLDAL